MSEELIANPSSTTATEQKLVAMWKDILQVDALTVSDRFMDLGGDSLAAMLCISRVRTAFGIEFGIEDFFWDHATIAEFAAVIDQSRSQPSTS